MILVLNIPRLTWSCSHWPSLDFKRSSPSWWPCKEDGSNMQKDFGKFASLRTKSIGTWPYLTSPWVTWCPNTLLYLILLLIFYFLGNIPFHPFPLMFKWTKLWTWTTQPLGLGSSQKGLYYLRRLCPWPWRTCPLHNIKTPYGIHTRWWLQT